MQETGAAGQYVEAYLYLLLLINVFYIDVAKPEQVHNTPV